MRSQGSPTGADELAQKYEILLAEKAAADKEHQEAVAKLKESLTQDHEQAFSKLQSEYNALQERAAKTDQEQSDAIELLKEEFKTGHSNDMAALRQQLGDVQKRHSDLTEQKASMDQAHEEAISELMAGMEASTNDALQQLREKYDALTAELEAERLNHISELETARREAAEQQSLHQAASQQSQSPEVADTSASDVAVYEEKLRVLEQERNKAIRAAEDAEDRIETMKGEVVRKHLARVEPLEKENAFLLDKIDRLEAMLAAGDRIARVAATVGERRNINSLAEEDEDSAEDAWPGAQPSKVNGTGDHKDVVGTVS
jgi:DNA repair exonuclease SbcCD ATPase subunit